MTDKKHAYQSDIIALPPLRMVLGDVPDPNTDDKHRLSRVLGKDKQELEARKIVTKLIGHLKNNEK
ncbi:MAG: hypothetical protein NTW32_04430 [Chloroflexi bacterium]|nr:hypothetical protein [Chloroflexota bacterium]